MRIDKMIPKDCRIGYAKTLGSLISYQVGYTYQGRKIAINWNRPIEVVDGLIVIPRNQSWGVLTYEGADYLLKDIEPVLHLKGYRIKDRTIYTTKGHRMAKIFYSILNVYNGVPANLLKGLYDTVTKIP